MTDTDQQTGQTDQAEAITYFLDPEQHGGAEVTHVQTHGAHVFLADEMAYKIKRAVAYDYMDFSTLERRHAMLARELELNRPAAPGIYLDVVPLARSEGGVLSLGGNGSVVEWVLRMARFPAEDELSAIADRGALTDPLAARIGEAVQSYHAAAPLRQAPGAQLMADILTELETAFDGMETALGPERIATFRTTARAAHERVAPLLDRRATSGHVRRCHGDLYLDNIVMLDGRPVPFDALEFDETLGTCDVLYDLAFLLMDLRHRGLDRAACIARDAWLFAADTTEDAGTAALPYFLGVRAAIRAMVEVQTGRAAGDPARHDAEARRYLDDALRDFAPPPPRLLVVGGLSGTGKTTLARALAPLLAPSPGAVHLRSDLERKRLAGVDPLERLPAEAYAGASSHAVYDRLVTRADTLLAAGQSVVLDATWLAPAERAQLDTQAERRGVPLAALWLEADTATLQDRVTKRRNDASDADAAVVYLQARQARAPAGWLHVDASGDADETLCNARKALQL